MKQKLAMLLVVGMVVTSLAGCADKTEETATATTGTGQPVTRAATEQTSQAEKTETMELKVFGFKTGAEEGTIPGLIETFDAEDPDINTIYEGISNADGYQDVLAARLASGQGDDIFFADPDYLPRLQEAGYAEDLTNMPVIGRYSILVESLLTINDSVPGLGTEVAVFGLYTNTDLLKEVGIEKSPSNYEEFLATCEILKNAGKTSIITEAEDGTGVSVSSVTESLDAVYQADDKLDQIAKINEGELEFGQVVEPGSTLVEELIDKGYLDDGKALVYATGQNNTAEFTRGDVDSMPGGSWFASNVQKAAPGMDYTFSGVPVQEEDSLILVNTGVRVRINSASEKKDTARRFVEYFTSVDSMNAYVAGQSSFNPRTDGTSTGSDITAPAARRLVTGRMLPWMDSAFDNTVVNPWADAETFTANIAGGIPVGDVVTDLNTQVENNLELKQQGRAAVALGSRATAVF